MQSKRLFMSTIDNNSKFFFVCFFLVVSFLGLTSCTSVPSLSINDNIIKSPVDKREYRSMVLPNGLQVLLISDMEAEQAAAALDVSVGSGDDDRAGIAHFLEHMLFLGTAKYPESGEYQSFISAHGGQHNAYTSYEHTNYFFDVDPAYINEALDRFSRFFIDPLFTEDYVEREKHAVDSEYRAKIRNEARRSLDVFKQLVSPEHRYAKFSVGSLDTLSGDELRADVMRFYEQHYSADRMKLVVLAPQSLDQLQQNVANLFAQVPKRKTERILSSVPLLPEENLANFVYFEPLVDKKELTFSFSVPLLRPYISERPIHYISHILGHEGDGSLLQLLKTEGLATGLAAGPGLDALDAASMAIQIELTDAGLQQKDLVIEYVFAAIKNLKTEGVLERIYQELATTSELNFKYQQTSSPLGTVSALANYLHRFDAENVLYASYKMDHFDAKLIQDYLLEMTPDKALIAVTAKGINADRTSPWFFTPYRVEPFSQEQLERWNNPSHSDALYPPMGNELLPDSLEVLEVETAEKPRLIRNDDWQLWFAEDVSFETPRANIRINLRSSIANDSIKNSAILDLYIASVQEQIDVLAYDAYLANMAFTISAHGRGLSVEVAGYSDKQNIILERLAKALRHPELSEQRFEAIKQRLIRAWSDNKKQQPYTYLMEQISLTLLDPVWSPEELAVVAEDLTFKDVQQFAVEFLGQLSLEALVHGNYQQHQAELIVEGFSSQLGATFVKERPEFRVRKLQEQQRSQQKSLLPHKDAALALYWQSPELGYKARAAFALTAQILQPLFFDELRTEKQLGYVVFTSNLPILEVPGIGFVVQSPKVSAAELEQEVEQFLSRQWLELSEMPEQLFLRNKSALITRLEEKPQRLSQLTDQYWGDIALQHTNFDDKQQLTDVLKQLQFDDWLIFISQAWKQGGQVIFWAPGDKSLDIPSSLKTVPEKNKADFYQIK